VGDEPTRLSIEVVGGDLAPAELPRSGRLIIGSSKERAGFVVEGQGVEAVHCAIGRIKGGGWALKDMGSEHGTLVNGTRVSSARLTVGDAIVLGSKRLRVFDPERPAEGARPEPAAPAAAAPPRAPRATGRPREGSAPPKAGNGNGNGELQVRGYRIERMIGRGGMGRVFLAVQESLDRRVALKILSPELANDREFVERFQAEARAAAALNHPNVVHVYDVGEDGGHHYLSMEYMDASCLETRVATSGPIGWRDVLRILSDAASGLVYAEARGIVHRDIKPANLMQNADGVTKIADLGLAVQVEQEEVQAEGRKILGTPHFIAPELIRGNPPDCRSDLYSLGATAYRLLSGHTPFEGSTSNEILRRALFDEPTPLAQRVPDVPPGLALCIERLLEKDPAARHPSAGVLLAELERLKLDPTDGAPDRPAVRPRGVGRKLAVAAFGVLLLGAVGFGAKALLGGDDDRREDGGNNAFAREPHGTSVGPPLSVGPTTSDAEVVAPASTGPPTTVEAVDDEPDETTLALFEANAKLAFRDVQDEVLAPDRRIARLNDLIAEYDGTDAATAARIDVTAIEVAQRQAATAAHTRSEAAREVLANIAASAALDADPPRPGLALRAMMQVPGQAELAGYNPFQIEREKLMDDVVGVALDWGRARERAAEKAFQAGDFEAMRAELTSVVEMVDISGLDDAGAPPRMSELRALAAEAQTRIDSIGRLRAGYATRMEHEDRTTIATELGGSAGFESELRRLDLDAATDRLGRALERLGTPRAKARVEVLRTDLELAAWALVALGAAWDEGEWRRKTIVDLRGRRLVNRVAMRANETGVYVEVNGASEHLPWSTWGGDARQIHKLFNERLTRDWKPEELRGIEALLRSAAVLEAIDVAGQVLQSDARLRISDGEVRSIEAVFSTALEWAEAAGATERLLRERKAFDGFIAAASAASVGAWSRAVESTERVLEEYEDTLFVTLLSDGGDWHAAPIVAPEAGDPDEENRSKDE